MKQSKGSKILLNILRGIPDCNNHGFGIRLSEADIALLNSTIRKGNVPNGAFITIEDRKPVLKWYDDGYECLLDNLDKHFPAETLNTIAERIKTENNVR